MWTKCDELLLSDGGGVRWASGHGRQWCAWTSGVRWVTVEACGLAASGAPQLCGTTPMGCSCASSRNQTKAPKRKETKSVTQLDATHIPSPTSPPQRGRGRAQTRAAMKASRALARDASSSDRRGRAGSQGGRRVAGGEEEEKWSCSVGDGEIGRRCKLLCR